MTRWRTTWILFGLAAVLFAFIMLVERRARPGRAGAEPPARLFAFKAAEVTNIALHLTNQLLLRVATARHQRSQLPGVESSAVLRQPLAQCKGEA